MIMCWWNVRGLNDPLKIKEVKSFLAVHNVKVCGFFETRVKENIWGTKSSRFGRHWNWHANYSANHKGRIWVGWQPDFIDCDIIAVGTQFIHCRCIDKVTLAAVYVSFIYGLHIIGDRRSL